MRRLFSQEQKRDSDILEDICGFAAICASFAVILWLPGLMAV